MLLSKSGTVKLESCTVGTITVKITVGVNYHDYIWKLQKAHELCGLGVSQGRRYSELGQLTDIEASISSLQQAVELTDDENPNKPSFLSNLGTSQASRFERTGKLSDLANALSNHAKSIELADDGHPDKHLFFSHLGGSQYHRFKYLGELSDLENAISNSQKGVELTDDRDYRKPGMLSNLGTSQFTRFERLGELSDLTNALSNHWKAVDLADDGHPDKPLFFSHLGTSQYRRFKSLGELSDLENAISNSQKAIELTDDGDPRKPSFLSNLGTDRSTRFERLGELSDLSNAISNHRKAVELTNDGFSPKPAFLLSLGQSQATRFERLGELSDLTNAISNHEQAVELTDDGHPDKPDCLSSLGISQKIYFQLLGVLSDLENAISNLGKAVELTNDGNPYKPSRLSSLSKCQHLRFERLGQFSDLEKAVTNMRKAVELTDDGHPQKSDLLSNLGSVQGTRFECLGELPDLANAISNMGRAVELTDDVHPKKSRKLSNLGNIQHSRFASLGLLSDLTDAISSLRQAVDMTDDRNPDKHALFSNLGIMQTTRFERLGGLPDLADAISNLEMAVDLVGAGHPSKAVYLSNLGRSQECRFNRLKERPDLVASVSSFKAAAQSMAAYPSTALHAARRWAEAAHRNGDLVSALEGYRTALETLPKVAWLGLDAPSRHEWLRREKSEDLGCLAAACAIQLGRFEEAVELLDLGRSVFWQQASSLRSDLDTLREEAPGLARELEGVGRELDTWNFSAGLSSMIEDSDLGKIGVGNAEDIVKERHRQVDAWEKLVAEVRTLPGFTYFLSPIPFRQLRQAATPSGQVVIVNASEYGVDALIFAATGPIEYVPLSDFITIETLAELSENLALRQPVHASTAQRQAHTKRFLKQALRIVWTDILIHIFDRIHIPGIDVGAPVTRRRLWWYPTGPLTFIPIHASGNGHTDHKRHTGCEWSQNLKEPQNLKLLSISQPETPGQISLPQTTEEVDEVVQICRSAGLSEDDIVCLRGVEATVDRVSNALGACSWAHIACHGSQHPILGMKSAFALHDGLLELGEIAAKRISTAQFAFLSACQSAAGVKDLPGEAMHLAAGLQFAGFMSVIATMWGICDRDAREVAKYTYGYLFQGGVRGLEPSDAAAALNHAVMCLREDGDVTVDRWAPFVHYGI